MAVSQNPVVKRAQRTVGLIGGIKTGILILIIVGAAVLVIAGIASWTTRGLDFNGNFETHTNPFAVYMVLYGVIGGVFWSLITLALGGWLEGMLATNAEKLRLAYEQSPEAHLEY